MIYKEKIFLGITINFLLVLGVLSHSNYLKRNNYELNIFFAEDKSNFLNDSLVNKLLIQKINNASKQSNLKLDLMELEFFLESLPEVHNAEVYSYIEGDLNTMIYESTALLRIQNEGFYLDVFGDKIPFSDNYTPKVPIYSGVFGDKKTPELIRLSNLINRDNYLKKEFVEIWDEKSGFTIRLRNHDFEIFWGHVNNNKEKIDKLKAFCAYLIKNKVNKKLKRIDLTIQDQIVSIH